MTFASNLGKHFTLKQFCDGLQISLREGCRIIARKEVGIVRIGRLVRIPAEVERFIASRFESPVVQNHPHRQRTAAPGTMRNLVTGVLERHRRGVR